MSTAGVIRQAKERARAVLRSGESDAPVWRDAAAAAPKVTRGLIAEVVRHPAALQVLVRRPDFSAEHAEITASFIVGQMNTHPNRPLLVEQDEAGLRVLVAEGVLTAQSPAARDLFTLAERPADQGHFDARVSAPRVLLAMPDLPTESLHRLLAVLRHPILVFTLARHPSADESVWLEIVERFPRAPFFVSVLRKIPRAVALPEVRAFIRRQAEADASYLGEYALILDGDEFRGAMDQVIEKSEYQVVETLEQADPARGQTLSPEQTARLLSQSGDRVREAVIRALGRGARHSSREVHSKSRRS